MYGGGGIYLKFLYGTNLAIRNSTITGNQTSGQGGGIYSWGSSAYDGFTLSSSIVSGNTAGTAADIAISGYYSYYGPGVTEITADNNLVGVANQGSFTLSGSGNLTGTSTNPLAAKLGPLADNGGPTKTHALLAGSPATNKGSNVDGLTTDQRGKGRCKVANPTSEHSKARRSCPRRSWSARP